MRVRIQDANGDYLLGNGSSNFYINSAQGVGQTVETRLLLWEGEFFLDNTEGTPWSQEVVGYGTSSLRDMAIKTRILGTPFVVSIESYISVTNPATRAFTVSGTVLTTFSPKPVPFGPVVL